MRSRNCAGYASVSRKREAAIGRLLMAVIRDRADRHGERRKRARLPLVMAGLDEMEEMIVRPMTRLDNRAAFGVPRHAVGIAGPSETIWNSRVRGCTRQSAQLNLYSLPLFERSGFD